MHTQTYIYPKYSLIHLYSGALIEIHAKLNLMSSCSLLCSFILAHILPCVSPSLCVCECVLCMCYLRRERLSQYKNSVTIYLPMAMSLVVVAGAQYPTKTICLFDCALAYLNLRITIGIYYCDVFIQSSFFTYFVKHEKRERVKKYVKIFGRSHTHTHTHTSAQW